MLRAVTLLAVVGLSSARGDQLDYRPAAGRGSQDFSPANIQHGQCNTTVAIYEDVSTPSVTPHNHNRPLTCWYEFRPAGASSSDYVIDIQFKRFNVGMVHNSSTCRDGYVQIIDGSSDTTVTNRKSPGFFCGEMQDSRNFISETNTVRMIFHTDNFTEDTYISFFSRTEFIRALHERYGKQPELYPGGRRGKAVGRNNYCERMFTKCRTDSCFVQSPAYPGPYPRNLRCRYHLSVENAYIRLYTADQEVSIDGQRCDSPMVCPLRPLTSKASRCTRDFITIYDGEKETAPKIGTFCGFGRFPYSITGSGTRLLVTFTSSAAGPLLNDGFQFTVGSVPGKRDTQGKLAGLCDWVFGARRLKRSGQSSGQFSSLAHWYPANTTCRHLIRADTGQKVRLRFTSFRVDPITAPLVAADGDCAESLAVYDGPEARPSRLQRLFCDTFSAPAKSNPIISSGRTMLVLFTSRTGSFEASSLFYRASFDFFREAWWGAPVAGTRCDETFSARRAAGGRFGGPQNRLVFETAADLRCRYTFAADARRFARVLLNITTLSVRDRCPAGDGAAACLRAASRVVVTSPPTAARCLCRLDGAPQLVLTDRANATVRLTLSADAASRALNDGLPVLAGTYHFVHGPFCGPTEPAGDTMRYPALDYQPREPTYCVWEVAVGANSGLWFQARQLRLAADCAADSLQVFAGGFRLLHRLCAGAEGTSHAVPAGSVGADGRLQFHFRSRSPTARLLVHFARLPGGGGGGDGPAPTASHLVAMETAAPRPARTTTGAPARRGAVSRWREIGMLGGGVTTLCCLAAVAVWWCRGRSCRPPPGQEERCLTSETEPPADDGSH